MESLKQLVMERRQYIDRYCSISLCVKGKSETEEVGKMKKELSDIKEKISKYNETITREFKNYEKNRNENLKQIMGCYCYSDQEKSTRIIELNSRKQINFPWSESEINPSPNSKIEKEIDDEFEAIDLNSYESSS